MRYLLDTNIASYIINGHTSAARDRLMLADTRSEIAISTITQAEVLFDLEKMQSPRLRSFAEELFTTMTILPWDTAAATTYSSLRKTLNASGINLSVLDLLIASHAISLNATLVTHDRAFRHLTPRLLLEDWATDL